MTSKATKKILAIDANSLIHRAFHALPPLTTPTGRPAQALYGVASALLKLWRSEQPTYAAALFDRPEPTFRKKEYAEYKATRPKAPDELVEQIIAAHDLFPKFGIPVFEAPGFEADDLIATLATRFGGKDGAEVCVLTGDMDTLQLVRDGQVSVRVFRKGITDTIIYDENGVRERYGLRPDQLVDYKALVGDASDNIKGVPGIGPKTATSWLLAHDNLDAILAKASTDPKLSRLKGREGEALASRRLVVLVKNAPLLAEKIEDLSVRFKEDVLVEYFSRLGFSSLAKRLLGPTAAENKSSEQVRSPQGKMF